MDNQPRSLSDDDDEMNDLRVQMYFDENKGYTVSRFPFQTSAA